jgi:GYF domain 2
MIGIIILVITGTICAAVASGKGRNPVGWFFIGFFCPLIGLILVCVISNRKEEQAHRFTIEQENRRLREQIRQEQIKSEAFRTHTQRRLDAHDQKLGLDTRPDDRVLDGSVPVAGMLDSSNPPLANAVSSQPAVEPEANQPGWYYAIDGQTYGPVAPTKMVQLLQVKAVPWSALVWIEGMADWAPAERVPQLSALVTS